MEMAIALLVGGLVFGSFWANQNVVVRKTAAQTDDKPKEAQPPTWYRNIAPLMIVLAPVGAFLEALFSASSKQIAERLIIAGLKEKVTVANVWTARVIYAPFFAFLLGGMGFLLDTVAGKENGALWFFGMIPGLLMGFTYPTSQLRKAVDARQKAIARALPFVFDLLNAAVSAGQSFSAAVQSYLDLKFPGPLTEEFSLMMREQQVTSRDTALRNMAERIQLETFTYFAEAVINSDKTGATLSETIRIQAEEMRKARFNMAERLAAKAPTKILFPMILFIMPAVFIIIGAPVAIRIIGVMGEMK